MRWAGKVCHQCGGDLYADYAHVALVCLKCGYHERPLPRSRAAMARLVMLVDVCPRSRRLIEGLCATHGCRVMPLRPIMPPTGTLSVADADLLIVEADRAGLGVALARRLREQAPAVPIAVILTSWSDWETEARATAEFVIHAPVRENEVKRTLEIIEYYLGWLPSPLLAAEYRSGAGSPEVDHPPLHPAGGDQAA